MNDGGEHLVTVLAVLWGLLMTLIAVVISGMRLKNQHTPQRFWFGELVVEWLYMLASIMLGIAAGADEFLVMYRDKRREFRSMPTKAKTARSEASSPSSWVIRELRRREEEKGLTENV